MPSLSKEEISSMKPGESSETVKKRVNEARAFASKRFNDGSGIYCNAKMTARQIKQHCTLTDDASDLLSSAYETIGMSARGYDRILKIARTIADLDASDDICAEHIGEAIQLRTLDRSKYVTG